MGRSKGYLGIDQATTNTDALAPPPARSTSHFPVSLIGKSPTTTITFAISQLMLLGILVGGEAFPCVE